MDLSRDNGRQGQQKGAKGDRSIFRGTFHLVVALAHEFQVTHATFSDVSPVATKQRAGSRH